MLRALLGRKLNMSQIWDTHGRATPVTKLSVEPNVIVALREKDKDGYKAAQVGIGVKKHPNQPSLGHVKAAKLKNVPAVMREVEFEGEVNLGQEVRVDEVFRRGGMVDVIGTSKGKGFAGGIKRWGFHGGPKTHGQSDRHRAPGSIGSGTTPGRVQKGLHMAGHLGNAQITVFGLEIMEVNKEENTLLIKGSVPGFVGAEVLINKSKRKKEVYHEPEIPTAPVVGSGDQEEAPSEEVNENSQVTNEAPAEEVKVEGAEG